MDEELRDRLNDVLDDLGCPGTAADAVMEVIAPVLAERDQYRAVAQFAEAQRAHQRKTIEELQDTQRRLRQTLRDIRGR